jgi:hypothetical protein
MGTSIPRKVAIGRHFEVPYKTERQFAWLSAKIKEKSSRGEVDEVVNQER